MIEPTILFENDELVAIDKPAGLMVHPDGKTGGETLVSWILARYPETEGVGEPLTLYSGERIERPGVVHRLDRETSGVLVLARTGASFENLKHQFQNRLALKTYRAFVHGLIKDERGIIDRPLGRNRETGLWSATVRAAGVLREARTEFRVLARGEGATYVEVSPKTGRTHQIRVHFKAIQHPVVCDPLYGKRGGCILGFERLALHALRLSVHLLSGEEVTFEAPLPEDFLRAESALRAER